MAQRIKLSWKYKLILKIKNDSLKFELKFWKIKNTYWKINVKAIFHCEINYLNIF